MQARHYDNVTGRFISQDPAKQRENWFTYCNNDPVNMVDPNGKMSVKEYAQLIEAIMQALVHPEWMIPTIRLWGLRAGGLGRLLSYVDILIARLGVGAVSDETLAAQYAQEAEGENELMGGIGASDALLSAHYGTCGAGKIQAIAALQQVKMFIEIEMMN